MAADTDGNIPEINIRDEEAWSEEPVITFEQRASLEMARWVLAIFAGVYLLCFVMSFFMFFVSGVTYDAAVDLVKFMLASILPLVTLAVGYYLGERTSAGG